MKMKKILASVLSLAMYLSVIPVTISNAAAPPVANKFTPEPQQLKYLKEEMSAFIHYGMNTFTGSEWGDGTEAESRFAPTVVDTDQWVRELKAAGFKRIIYTAKHHDGFCTFQSQYTTHDMEGSPYKGGAGDILQELSQSCTKYNMDMGLYLSLWDVNAVTYGYGTGTNQATDTNGDYNDYYNNQLNEVLGKRTFVDTDGTTKFKYGNNGKFVQMWMDGAKGSGSKAQMYDFDRFYTTMRTLQPGIAIFCPYVADVRWIGNERGIAGDPNWSRINKEFVRDKYLNAFGSTNDYLNSGDKDNSTVFSVGECDVSMRGGWFFHPNESPKTMEQLNNIYFKSVGRGGVLLLNVPPSQQGVISPPDVARLREFSTAINNTFATDFTQATDVNVTATASNVRGNDATYDASKLIDGNYDTYWATDDAVVNDTSVTINLGKPKTFDVVSIQEHIELGQRIEEFKIEYKNNEGTWASFGKGFTVGPKRLIQGTTTTAQEIKITFIKSEACPVISSVGVFKAPINFESAASAIPQGVTTIAASDMTKAGNWTMESTSLGNNKGMYTNATGASATFTFTGTKFWISNTVDPGHGNYKVTIDGVDAGVVNTNGTPRVMESIGYASAELAAGTHTVKITPLLDKPNQNFVGIAAAHYIGAGISMFDIEDKPYKVLEGDAIDVTVKRSGDTTAAATVTLTTPPGTAVQGQYYVDHTEVLSFAAGETSKTVRLQTIKEYENSTPTLSFYASLSSPTGGAVLGFNKNAEIVIDNSDINTQPPAATVYTAENRFILPTQIGTEKRLEAENVEIVAGATSATIGNLTTASNGKIVDAFSVGNKLKLYYNAPSAGIYQMKLSYKTSGASAFSVTGDKITAINNRALTSSNSALTTNIFDVTVNTAGDGIIEITAGTSAGFAIDKIDISHKASGIETQTPTTTVYSATDRFTFPSELGKMKRLEGEYCALDASTAVGGATNAVRVADLANTSNGKIISNFTNGNKIVLHYNAPIAGKYTATVHCAAGATNSFTVKGPNITATTFSTDSTGGGTTFVSKSFDLVVTTAGESTITLAAEGTNAPRVDYIDFALVEFTSKSVAPIITANLPREMLISSGETKTLSVTAQSLTGVLSYRWYKGSTELVGETGNSITVPFANLGNYYVVVTNTEPNKSPTITYSVACSVIEKLAGQVLYGDVNDDGIVDLEDALIALKCSATNITLTEKQIETADKNASKTIEQSEVNALLEYVINR